MSWIITTSQYPNDVLEAAEVEFREDAHEALTFAGEGGVAHVPRITAHSVIVRRRDTWDPVTTHSILHVPGTAATLEWRVP